MALDVALLVLAPIALGLALFFTRRLETEDPIPATAEPPVPPVVVVSALGLALIPGLLLLVRPPPHLIVGVVHLCVLCVLARIVAVQSRIRRACRVRVARATVPSLMLALVATSTNLWQVASVGEGYLRLALLLLLAVLALGAAGVGRIAAPLLALLMIPGMALLGTNLMPRGDVTVEDAAACVDAFDKDVRDRCEWEDMGRTAHWLHATGVAHPTGEAPARVIRKAMAARAFIPSSTFNAAFDAGLFSQEDVDLLRATRDLGWAREVVEDDGPIRVGAATGERIRLLVGLDLLDETERARLVERLCVSWPNDEDDDRLEETREICLLLDLLGASDRIHAREAELHDLLRRSWCAEPTRHSASGGFLRSADSELGSDEDATWLALEIMAHVGVPDGIDLEQTATWLREAVAPSCRCSRWFDREPLESYDRGLHLTWLRLRTDHAVLETPLVSTGALAVLACALALMAYCVIIVLRAPQARILPPV